MGLSHSLQLGTAEVMPGFARGLFGFAESQSETSRPSIFTSCLIFPPAKETNVGNTSVVPAMPADSVPGDGARPPGEVGSRTRLPARSLCCRATARHTAGFALGCPRAVIAGEQHERVFGELQFFKASNTCPMLQSTSSTQSPYTPFLDLPEKSGCGYSGTCMAV